MEEIKKTQNKEKQSKKNKQKQMAKAKKDKYFAYYDDIKVGSHKVVDW